MLAPVMELARRGFAIENDWYWRITENARTFEVATAIADFLAPLARSAKDTVAITDLAADGGAVQLAIDGQPATITINAAAHDRVAINHFVADLNRALAASNHAFALVVPRRYELRGVLLREPELGELLGRPELLVPSGRSSSGSIRLPA